MPIPDYRSQVADAAARYPDAWRNAHTGGPRTEEFIRLLARDLHAIDPDVGLNGKRGNPDDISDDALAVFTADGDVTDRSGRRMVIVDVIADAGGPNPQPAWQSVGGPSPGAWVQPQAVDVPNPGTNVPNPQPPKEQWPPIVVCNPDLLAQMSTLQSAVVFLTNQSAAWRNDSLETHRQLDKVLARLDALAAQIADVRAAQDRPLTVALGHRWLGDINGTVAVKKEKP